MLWKKDAEERETKENQDGVLRKTVSKSESENKGKECWQRKEKLQKAKEDAASQPTDGYIETGRKEYVCECNKTSIFFPYIFA